MTDAEKAARVKRLTSGLIKVLGEEDPLLQAPQVLALALGALLRTLDTTLQPPGRFLDEVVRIVRVQVPEPASRRSPQLPRRFKVVESEPSR